jgi:stage II sporulation protein Q
MNLYSYTKKKNNAKKVMIFSLGFLLVLSVGVLTYSFQSMNKEEDTPVFNENPLPVIALPDTETEAPTEEKAIRPYTVEAVIALKHYDPNSEDSDDVTLFEGKYRGNEGIDYSYNDEAFDVCAIFSGTVSDVKEDPLFGHSLTITSGDIAITYQSLDGVALENGAQVKQGDILGKAGVNVYNKDLNHHLHVVAKKGRSLLNPESLYDKTASEIK